MHVAGSPTGGLVCHCPRVPIWETRYLCRQGRGWNPKRSLEPTLHPQPPPKHTLCLLCENPALIPTAELRPPCKQQVPALAPQDLSCDKGKCHSDIAVLETPCMRPGHHGGLTERAKVALVVPSGFLHQMPTVEPGEAPWGCPGPSKAPGSPELLQRDTCVSISKAVLSVTAFKKSMWMSQCVNRRQG